mmetsp:Transcript_20230/g.45993  ORF Transcript_20230/g.45993 Transcript_20230/m.45993 type:complete len:710 (+) Transcript_20230:52-2181(+)|eukprot:CAMPEP_0201224544 /NCGR_PEP_ID=MMETSP0851-20130426/193670_1 /ASSEMBLY_ACC=CAM_ASM_000631 /TAXON_ID=183588 /ORGANISM="Pseudo-nitzschia fraudulenta, Strain WWA7" /LENGTH=709 /DNA_ID=CAMNT_0047514311 /DNA_START=41 /DNA_END=2170 /DNA_ORIENTATION=+
MIRDNDLAQVDNNCNCVKFVIGQTLRKLSQEEQVTRTIRLDNGGVEHIFDTCSMTHDWKVHLDVTEGDPNPIIARVEADFGPTFLRRRRYVWNRPRKMRNGDKENVMVNNQQSTAWRCFESRQKCAGTPPIIISIVGMGGTVLRVTYHSHLDRVEGYFYEKNISTFGTVDGPSHLIPIPLPSDRSFSVERVSASVVGADVESDNRFSILSYNLRDNISWKTGEEGINNIRQSLIESTNHIINDSGTHLANIIISIELFAGVPKTKNIEDMIKMCQNFIKYEDAIDKIIQINRKSKGLELEVLRNESLCVKSNKRDVEGDTNRLRHDRLALCSNNVSDLIKVMNPRKSERYKLMFAREENTENFTAQFFFHGVPDDIEFTVHMLRFCTMFVHNSFRLQKPKSLKPNRTIDQEIDFLFSMVIRDRFVEKVLLRGVWNEKGDDDSSFGSCCSIDVDKVNEEDPDIISVLNKAAKNDESNKSSGLGHFCSPSRKRGFPDRDLHFCEDDNTKGYKQPRHTIHYESFESAHLQVLDVDVVVRSHLNIENKYYTAAKLAIIGKNLSTGTSNNKKQRLERLKAYFNARHEELKKCIENIHHECNSSILGVELLLKNDANRALNDICLILRGGRKLTVPRRSVCKSKHNDNEFSTSLLRINNAEAKSIVQKLYRKEGMKTEPEDYIDKIDKFIDGLHNPQDKNESKPCRFALVHDLFN